MDGLPRTRGGAQLTAATHVAIPHHYSHQSHVEAAEFPHLCALRPEAALAAVMAVVPLE